MMTRMFYVYVDIRRDLNIAFYVGLGDEFRFKRIKRNAYHTRISKKHGAIRFVVFSSKNYDDAVAKEIELIACLKTFHYENHLCANFTRGGEGTLGHKHTEKSKEKMRNALRPPVSDETKLKIGKSSRGRQISDATRKKFSSRKRIKTPEECEKLSRALRGRKFTEEHKAKISIKMKGRVLSIEHRTNISKAIKVQHSQRANNTD